MSTFEQSRRSSGNYLFRPDAARPLGLLAQCPSHAATPLNDCPQLATDGGVARLWVKDESARMGLGSFKALGGAYAVAQMIVDAAGTDDLTAPVAHKAAAQMVFVTASAGNHGLSVAAGARIFGARAIIVLSAAVPEAFANRIHATGAEVLRTEGSYDDSVALARSEAAQNGWILLADGSWEGYVERPALVMEGYCVIAEEIRQSFAASRHWPSHVYLHAGVGGLAAAIAAHIRLNWPKQPRIIIVEPDAAPCLLNSMKAGRLTRADGPLSNMGRLDCKDASLIAFEALRNDAEVFMTITDDEASAAAEQLTRHGMATTPSGAAGLAALLRDNPGPDAQCLMILSEGPC